MDTFKKVLLTIIYVILLGGTITGIVFGVKYNDLSQNSNSEYVVMLENENEQLNKDKTNLQYEIVIVNAQIAQKDEQIEELESAHSSDVSLINNLKLERQSLIDEKNRLESLLAEKEQEIADLYYDLLTLADERLSMSVISKRVDSIVEDYSHQLSSGSLAKTDIYQVSDETNELYAGTDNNKVILDIETNFVVGSYYKVESTSSNVHIDRVVPTTLETPGYYNPHGQVGIASVSSNMYYLVYTEGVIEEVTQEVLTITLYDYKDRVLKSVNYTLTLHPQAGEPFSGFTTEEMILISNSVKGFNVGRVDSLDSYYVEGETLHLFFKGINGYGEECYFITYITGYTEGLTSTDICDMIKFQGNGSESYTYLSQYVENENVALSFEGVETDLNSIIVNVDWTSTSTSTKFTYKVGVLTEDRGLVVKSYTERKVGSLGADDIDYQYVLSKVLSFAI